jgi:tripartite-type tricarboxylate transporter receptor subunit TctC
MTRILALAFGLILSAAPLAARADYPDKVVRIVVPVAAGGGVDVMARMLAQKLSERLGQQFVVENRPGATGVIGTKAVIGSPADGYTLLYTPTSLSLTVAVHKATPYDLIASTPEEFGAQVKNDVVRWSEVVKRANVPMN